MLFKNILLSFGLQRLDILIFITVHVCLLLAVFLIFRRFLFQQRNALMPINNHSFFSVFAKLLILLLIMLIYSTLVLYIFAINLLLCVCLILVIALHHVLFIN